MNKYCIMYTKTGFVTCGEKKKEIYINHRLGTKCSGDKRTQIKKYLPIYFGIFCISFIPKILVKVS